MMNTDTAYEECDANPFHSSNEAGFIRKITTELQAETMVLFKMIKKKTANAFYIQVQCYRALRTSGFLHEVIIFE